MASFDGVDVAIIGGGPAGSTAATLLKRYEPTRRIVLFERARFPRHHVGESTLPDMNPVLARLGVLDRIDAAGFVRKVGITYRWHHDRPTFSEVFSRGVLASLGPGTRGAIPDYAWQIDRSRYDTILLDHAREHGVEVHEGAHVDEVVHDAGRVHGLSVTLADGRRVSVASEFVVDCSGQARLLARALGLAKRTHALGDLAIHRYYRGMRWNPALVGSARASKIFFSATRAGWIWFIPLSEQDVSVGLVTRRAFLDDHAPDALFDAELASVPDMVAMLVDARPIGAPGSNAPPGTHTVSDWSYSHDRPSGPGYYLAGDAAAFVDPILSSGILLAHHSGLSVANAIRTEWRVPGIPKTELDEGYASFYRDLYSGFLRMATWWYERRDVGIDDWLRTARELGRGARGSAETDATDLSSFMTFAAGYLTDFRFVNVGCAFGDRGLADTLEGLLDGAPTADRLRREIRDPTVRLVRAFDRMDVEPYLATDVDSDRWWRLPAVRFTRGRDERVYRPPIWPEQREEVWLGLTLRVLERLTRGCDGATTIEALVQRTREAFPREHQARIHRLAFALLADLACLDLLLPAP